MTPEDDWREQAHYWEGRAVAARSDALEEAARVAESERNDPKLELTSVGLARNEACSDIAGAIRALKK